MRFPPGVAPIYIAPQPARPIFAAHIQLNPVAQPVIPCPMIAVTHTQLYPPAYGQPSTTYVLQAPAAGKERGILFKVYRPSKVSTKNRPPPIIIPHDKYASTIAPE